jgi:hypothetical protein
MGIVHRATLSPSKQELVESWLPTRPWGSGRRVAGKLGEYRFDDPAGEVGVETILWRTEDGVALQTPLTYRAAPLAGAQRHLIGTSEHSVLGPRWVYDGCGDPVWVATLAAAILTGGTQAQMFFMQDGERVNVPPRVQVHGSGRPDTALPVASSIDSVTEGNTTTLIRAGDLEIALARLLGEPPAGAAGPARLTGRVGQTGEPIVLASLRRL